MCSKGLRTGPTHNRHSLLLFAVIIIEEQLGNRNRKDIPGGTHVLCASSHSTANLARPGLRAAVTFADGLLGTVTGMRKPRPLSPKRQALVIHPLNYLLSTYYVPAKAQKTQPHTAGLTGKQAHFHTTADQPQSKAPLLQRWRVPTAVTLASTSPLSGHLPGARF